MTYLGTIYEACIQIKDNSNQKNLTQKYQGEINVDYEANTHFIIDQVRSPITGDMLKDEDINVLKKQATQVLAAA